MMKIQMLPFFLFGRHILTWLTSHKNACPQCSQSIHNSLIGCYLVWHHIRMRNMCTVIDCKTNSHDEIDHGHRAKTTHVPISKPVFFFFLTYQQILEAVLKLAAEHFTLWSKDSVVQEEFAFLDQSHDTHSCDCLADTGNPEQEIRLNFPSSTSTTITCQDERQDLVNG